MATYLIALVPDWKKIAKDARIPEEWLEGLEKSQIANFDIKEGRVGAFIDFSESTAELRNLPRLIQKHIPFWIFWGDGTTYRPPLQDKFEIGITELFRPSSDEVRLAKESARLTKTFFNIDLPDYSTSWDLDCDYAPKSASQTESPKNLSSLSRRAVNPENATVAEPPSRFIESHVLPIEPYSGYVPCKPGQVEKESRQLPSESPEQFWARQHSEDEAKLSNMTEAERKRLKNERDGYRITKKSRVYHWEKFSWGYVRRRVGREEFEDYSRYPLTQMRFSITRNEWDICSDFGADDKPFSPYPDSDDSCDYPKLQRPVKQIDHLQLPREDRKLDKQTPLSVPEEDGEILESDYVPVYADGPSPDEIVVITKRFQEAMKGRYTIRPEVKVRELADVALDKMLYYRYGLLLRNVHSIISAKDGVDEAIAEKAWATTRGILYDAESSTDSFSLQEMLGITHFVSLLLENSPLPATVIDVHPQNFDSPVAREMRSLSSTLHLKKCTLDGVVYLLRLDDSGSIVALEEPSLVVEVLRRGVDSLRNGRFDMTSLVRLFAHRGSPFRTLCFVKEPSIRLQPPLWELGYRTLDEEPGAYAYAQYEKLLQTFMCQPQSRSAFGLGGPVWRAIMEVHGLGNIVTRPSEDVSSFGRSFTLVNGDILWEDFLTESELLFLCGTYKVRKGFVSALLFLQYNVLTEDALGSNDMLYSWWPSPKQWETATSNVRYWSPGNERWFMTRLHDIRNGRATWVHMPKWPQKLKTNKKTKRLMEKNRSSCETFLEHSELLNYLTGRFEDLSESKVLAAH
ncbi:hypothetical protein ACEPAH_1679 [Sanghuangporus vaninii]